MVSPEVSAVTARDVTTIGRKLNAACICTTITAPVEPEMMPQMSPTTSLQKLDTLSAFRIRFRASLAPGVFLAAME